MPIQFAHRPRQSIKFSNTKSIISAYSQKDAAMHDLLFLFSPAPSKSCWSYQSVVSGRTEATGKILASLLPNMRWRGHDLLWPGGGLSLSVNLGDPVGEVGAAASRAGPHGSGGAALTLSKERRRLVDLHQSSLRARAPRGRRWRPRRGGGT